MSRHYSHSDYYRDRLSEAELCRDFPEDELFISGLNAMQMHMWNNGVQIDIPVVRVMNTAHFLAAYMFATTCSGDQLEYDALANDSLGQDRKLYRIAIIVLAAMLKRTEGFRAKNCRNILLENRDPDFEEGVTLYDRFLRSAEERFAEEDFLIDTNTQIQKLISENEQLRYEKQQLEIKYQLMEKQQNNQYNNCVIYNAPVYNTHTTNNYYTSKTEQAAKDITPVEPEPEDEPKSPKDIWGIPQKGKYNQVREYIKDRKKGDPEFKEYCMRHSLREICAYLTDEFGWDVDEHSLGANLNRNRYS